MGRLGRSLLVMWRGANALSTLQWLLGLLPAGVVGVIVGWIARTEQLPPVAIGVLALAAFTLAYVVYVTWRIERLPHVPQRALDQANSAAAHFWIRPVKSPAHSPPDEQIEYLQPGVLDMLKRALAPIELRERPSSVVERANRLAALHSLTPEPSKPTRDKPLSEGVAYIASGRWNEAISATLGYNPELFDMVIGDVIQRARDGQITVWGRPGAQSMWDLQKSPHEIVNPEHWRDHMLDETSLLGGEDGACSESRRHGSGVAGYKELMVSQLEFEREWPSEG